MANPPAQQDQYDGVILNSFDGLKNTVTRERLKPTELEKCRNIDIDDAGQIHSRRGRTLRSAGNWHSLRDIGGFVLGVKDGVLGYVTPDFGHHPLQSGIGSDPLDYTQAGGTVYFTSRTNSGKIDGFTVSPWGSQTSERTWLSPVVNPTATLGTVAGKLLIKPPMARYLTYYNGRIYLAEGNTIWATELWLYDHLDATKNFLQFEGEITGIGAVTDGIFVATDNGIFFCGGTFPLKRMPLAASRGVHGSMLSLPAELVRPQIVDTDNPSPSRNAVMFLTSDGLVAGFDNGELVNLTQPTFLFPDAQQAAAMFRKMDGVNQYVSVLNTGGDAIGTARIGDYADAEIRRFTGA